MPVFGGEEADGEGVGCGETGTVEADANFALLGYQHWTRD